MKTFTLITAIFISIVMSAQTSWTISHNNKVVLKVKSEDESKNVINIKKADLDKKGSLVVSYIKPVNDTWNRNLVVGDSTLESSAAKQNGNTISFSIPNATLKSLLQKQNKLMLYTVSIPSDPALAASVRVRRVHLCTVWLK
jgi:hypothetical protein